MRSDLRTLGQRCVPDAASGENCRNESRHRPLVGVPSDFGDTHGIPRIRRNWLRELMARPTSLRTILSRIFATSPRPIYLLDSAQRIVYHNSALAEWVNRADEDLVGIKCSYAPTHQAMDSTSEANIVLGRSLAAPPQLAASGEFQAMLGFAGNQRKAHFFSINDEDDSTFVLLSETAGGILGEPAFDSGALHASVTELRKEWNQAFRLDALIGESPALRQVRAQVKLAASSRACRVVIVGKSGTGRQTVARTIHREQTQCKTPLVPLDCQLLDEELLQATIESMVRQMTESETAGHTSITLLLLELNHLTLEAQASLVGLLEIGELGLNTLATTEISLVDLVEQQKFRHDLACRLSSLEIRLPSLTERIDDIPVLAQWMVEHSKHKKTVGGLTPEAMEALLRYRFPGELAELRELIDEATARATDSLISVEDLPRKLQLAADADVLPDLVEEDVSLEPFLAEVEAELISRALRRAKGNRAQAARSLGVSRGKLLRRIEQLGLGE